MRLNHPATDAGGRFYGRLVYLRPKQSTKLIFLATYSLALAKRYNQPLNLIHLTLTNVTSRLTSLSLHYTFSYAGIHSS